MKRRVFVCVCTRVLWFMCVCTCMHLGGLANKRVRVCGCAGGWGCCLNSKHDNPPFPFFPQLSLSSPKIGCAAFVTSHECLLNLLWRDLGVNLFPVEKAKLWNHEPKNKTCVTFGKPFMALLCNVLVYGSITAVHNKKSRGQQTWCEDVNIKQQHPQSISALTVTKMKTLQKKTQMQWVYMHINILVLALIPNKKIFS